MRSRSSLNARFTSFATVVRAPSCLRHRRVGVRRGAVRRVEHLGAERLPGCCLGVDVRRPLLACAVTQAAFDGGDLRTARADRQVDDGTVGEDVTAGDVASHQVDIPLDRSP
ncbi:MAG: hypothetical protein WKF76_11085 [Nocardioidaceae bacterium]